MTPTGREAVAQRARGPSAGPSTSAAAVMSSASSSLSASGAEWCAAPQTPADPSAAPLAPRVGAAGRVWRGRGRRRAALRRCCLSLAAPAVLLLRALHSPPSHAPPAAQIAVTAIAFTQGNPYRALNGFDR